MTLGFQKILRVFFYYLFFLSIEMNLYAEMNVNKPKSRSKAKQLDGKQNKTGKPNIMRVFTIKKMHFICSTTSQFGCLFRFFPLFLLLL